MGLLAFSLYSTLSITCGPRIPNQLNWNISSQTYYEHDAGASGFDGAIIHVNLENETHFVRGWTHYECDKALNDYCNGSTDPDCGHFTQLQYPTSVSYVIWEQRIFYYLNGLQANNMCVEIADLSHYDPRQAITEIVINEAPFSTNLSEATGRTVCLTFEPASFLNVDFVVEGTTDEYLYLAIRHVNFSLVHSPPLPPSLPHPPLPPALRPLTCNDTRQIYREVCCGAEESTMSGMYAEE